MRLRLHTTELYLRNSVLRIPFRYGNTCLTRCPQAILQAVVETDAGRCVGYSGDCLPSGWFDKSTPDYQQQLDDMFEVIALAQRVAMESFAAPQELFRGWLPLYERVAEVARERGFTSLLATFGVSLVERALMDAMCRAVGLSFAEAVRKNIFCIEPTAIHDSLTWQPKDWLPKLPTPEIDVRHTVGLGDPLTAAEIPATDQLQDGYPQALEQYVERFGIRFLKIKVSNQLDTDLERLRTIAALVEKSCGSDYRVTLDGNEQYQTPAEFDQLVDAIEGDARLRQLWRNTLVIEQPLNRAIALSPKHTEGIRQLGQKKPVIIDESDGELDAYTRALALGYRGVSCKNCKGPIKTLLNAGLTWLANDFGKQSHFVMTGEDLCSVGIVPMQADLCLAATIGLTHVERNGYHFHPGLAYLPEQQQRAALKEHADCYALIDGLVRPQVVDGKLAIESLQCPGFGFSVLPDVEEMVAANDWRYESLGL